MSLLEQIELFPERVFPGLKEKNYALYVAWTEVCHLVGSLVFLGVSHLIGMVTSLNVVLIVFIALVLWITYQEGYRHPRKYNQRLVKGILDWCTWVVPFVVYFTI